MTDIAHSGTGVTQTQWRERYTHALMNTFGPPQRADDLALQSSVAFQRQLSLAETGAAHQGHLPDHAVFQPDEAKLALQCYITGDERAFITERIAEQDIDGIIVDDPHRDGSFGAVIDRQPLDGLHPKPASSKRGSSKVTKSLRKS